MLQASHNSMETVCVFTRYMYNDDNLLKEYIKWSVVDDCEDWLQKSVL